MRGRRTSISVALASVALALVFGRVGTATAKDLCVDMSPAIGLPVVGKDFMIPAINKCKPFTGFVGANTLVSGTGCTNSGGDVFRLALTAYTAVESGSNPITVACTIPRPALTGGICILTVGTADPGIGNPLDELRELVVREVSAKSCTVAVP